MDKKTKTPALSQQSSRRLLGGELLMKGYEIDEVMEITGASLSAVRRWKKIIGEDGFSALARQGNSGNVTKLSDVQQDELRRIISAGAVASGFENECWNSRRIAKIILEKFGVSYHRNSIPRLMHAMKFSWQMPRTRAKKYSPDAAARWRKNVWPRIKKTRKSP